MIPANTVSSNQRGGSWPLKSRVEYKVFNDGTDTLTCDFNISVTDTTGPTIIFCPRDVTATLIVVVQM